MSKQYLKEGDIVFCTGAYLSVQRNGRLEVNSVEDESFFDGMPVCYDDDTGQFYTEDED